MTTINVVRTVTRAVDIPDDFNYKLDKIREVFGSLIYHVKFPDINKFKIALTETDIVFYTTCLIKYVDLLYGLATIDHKLSQNELKFHYVYNTHGIYTLERFVLERNRFRVKIALPSDENDIPEEFDSHEFRDVVKSFRQLGLPEISVDDSYVLGGNYNVIFHVFRKRDEFKETLISKYRDYGDIIDKKDSFNILFK